MGDERSQCGTRCMPLERKDICNSSPSHPCPKLMQPTHPKPHLLHFRSLGAQADQAQQARLLVALPARHHGSGRGLQKGGGHLAPALRMGEGGLL